MSNKLIDIVNVTKSFDESVILDHLNLYIRENEFLTLLGPSGCAMSVGCSLWTWCRKRGRCFEQLRCSPLYQPPHELASLHVGCRSLRRAIYHGKSTFRRRLLEHRLPVYRHPAGGPDSYPVSQPSSLEDPECFRRRLWIVFRCCHR